MDQSTTSQQRQVMFCHECQNEWYLDEYELVCPDCQSDCTEVIESGYDPRDDTATYDYRGSSASGPDEDKDNAAHQPYTAMPPRFGKEPIVPSTNMHISLPKSRHPSLADGDGTSIYAMYGPSFRTLKNRISSTGLILSGVMARDPYFDRREDVMGAMKAHLISRSDTVVLTGESGVGKTSVANEFVHRYKSIFSVIAWLKTESPFTLEQSLDEVIQSCFSSNGDIPIGPRWPAGETLVDWLLYLSEMTKPYDSFDRMHRWLVVFDDLTDFSLLQRFQCLSGKGSILITSRANAYEGSLLCSDAIRITLTSFSEEKGAEWLGKLLHISEESAGILARHQLKEIVRLLNGLPLAIRMFGDCIKSYDLTLNEALKLLEKGSTLDAATADGAKDSNVPETVLGISLDVSVRSLSAKALALLRGCAVLNGDGIPDHLFLSYGAQDAFLEHFPRSTADYFGARTELAKLCLVSSQGYDDNNISMHRLIQAHVIQGCPNDALKDSILTALALIGANCELHRSLLAAHLSHVHSLGVLCARTDLGDLSLYAEAVRVLELYLAHLHRSASSDLGEDHTEFDRAMDHRALQHETSTEQTSVGPSLDITRTSFEDSGYGSKSSVSSKQSVEKDQTASGTASIRTDGRANDLPQPLKEILISQFVSRLITQTRQNLATDIRLETLEDLLRDYAILVDKTASEDVHSQAVTFVRHPRKVIANHFAELTRAWSLLQPSTHITGRQRIEMLMGGPSSIEGVSQAATMAEYGDSASDLPDNPAVPVPQDVPQARDFLLDSEEFRWLIARLRLLTSRSHAVSTFDSVRKSIAGAIGDLASVGTLALSLKWNVRGFLTEQYGSHESSMSQCVVFCGSGDESYVTTAAEYLNFVWPEFGPAILKCIEGACRSPESVNSAVFTQATLEVSLEGDTTKIQLSGNARNMLEIGEACVWMATACRAAESTEGVFLCSPVLERLTNQDGGIIYLGVEPTYSRVEVDGSGALCWLAMVQNPVIAVGYPIPLRDTPDKQRGLEASLELMVGLSKAYLATEYEKASLLKGFISALVPVWENSTAIAWHFLFNADGLRMSYNQVCQPDGGSISVDINTSKLQDRRHFIGLWTHSARIIAGTDCDNLYDLHLSQSSPLGHNTIAWEGLSISAGTFIQVGTSFKLGKKDTSLTMSSSANMPYEWQLEQASDMTVLFYGDSDRRAWLLDGATALVHLAKAWLSSSKARNASKDALVQLEYPTDLGGKDEAIQTLLANRNVAISSLGQREASLSDQSSLPSTEDPSDSAYFSGSDRSGAQNDRNPNSAVATSWTYESLVLHFWRILEAMRDKVVRLESQTPEVAIRVPTIKPILTGWEAKDLVLHRTSRGQFHLRKIELSLDARHWLRFAKQIGSVVLLAETFGDLVRPQVEDPSCCKLMTATVDHDYLTVPLYVWRQTAERFLRRDGTNHSKGCVQITDHTYWHGFDPGQVPCQCGIHSRCSIISCLGDSARYTHGNIHTNNPRMNVFDAFPHGAAIIGDPSKLRSHVVDPQNSLQPEDLSSPRVSEVDDYVLTERHASGAAGARVPLQRLQDRMISWSMKLKRTSSRPG